MTGEAKSYMFWPFNDVRDFYLAAKGMTRHKLQRGKALPQLVFKDDKQREAFNQIAKQGLANLPSGESTGEDSSFEVATILDNGSRAGAHIGFRGLNDPKPRVYVVGHGSPATQQIMPTYQTPSYNGMDARDVAAMLAQLGLPGESNVRAFNCWSGSGKPYPKDSADWLQSFDDGSLESKSNTKDSFGYYLHGHLKYTNGLSGIQTHGYLLPIQADAGNALMRGGDYGQHMTAKTEYVAEVMQPQGPNNHPVAIKRMITRLVRRRDVRVAFTF